MAWRAIELARRSLSGMPLQVIADSTGGLLVVFRDRLVALAADLEPRWQRPWDARSILPSRQRPLFLADRVIHVLASDGSVSALATIEGLPSGTESRPLALPEALGDGRDRSGFTRFPTEAESRVLARIDGGFALSHEQTLRCVDDAGRDRWPPRHLASVPQSALAAGDRLLVLARSVHYTSWGYLGPALLVDLVDGTLVAELRGDLAAVTADGRFLLGLAPYDFHTRLHGRDGVLVRTWPTAGHAIPDPDGSIRIFLPQMIRIHRLDADGSVHYGDSIAEGQASVPVVLADGTAVFTGGGALYAIDRQLVSSVLARIVDVSPYDSSRIWGSLAASGDVLFAAFTDGRNTDLTDYTTDIAAFRLVAD